MTPEEIDALTLGGYLPFDCPRCDRRRLEFFLNSDGALCYCKCEKCGANSEDDSLSPTRLNPVNYQAGDRVKCRTSGALATVMSTPLGITLRLQWDNGGSGTYLPESVVPATDDQCEGPDDCDAHHPCQRHAAEANAGRFQQR